MLPGLVRTAEARGGHEVLMTLLALFLLSWRFPVTTECREIKKAYVKEAQELLDQQIMGSRHQRWLQYATGPGSGYSTLIQRIRISSNTQPHYPQSLPTRRS